MSSIDKESIFYAAIFTIVLGTFAAHVVAAQPDCIAAAPCRCVGSEILCNNHNLTTVPAFTVSTVNFTTITIRLTGNNIDSIPAEAFLNVSTTNCTNVRLYLDSNQLIDIDVHAFDGINDTLTSLNIHDNEIALLPKALTSLTVLNELSVYKNPINEYDANIMGKLSLTLTSLSIGAQTKYYKWPEEFKSLFNLQSLFVYYFEQQTIPADAFRGFKKTLTSLQLEYTDLSAIPRAVCELPNLKSFSFNFNTKLSSTSGIFPSCIPVLTSVKTAIIVGNDLDVFPPAFATFPNLTTLKVTNNSNLVYIDETAVDGNAQLLNLDLSFNGFEQFPEAVRKLTQLTKLNMAYNKMATIEEFNLPNMTALKTLDLSGNPITYISETAFAGVPNLEFLSLDNIAMSSLPKAVRVLSKLKSLSAGYNKFQCNCDMTWILTDWTEHANVTISGNCTSPPITLATFIDKYLPSCPKMLMT